MPQLTLHAPGITCDHCIATIRRATDAVAGARFVARDPDARSFVVDVAAGGTLDALSAALAAEGYPLAKAGSAPAAAGAHVSGVGDVSTHGDPRAVGWQPAFRVTRTDAGADVNYDCYCGCDAGFALDRAAADQPPEGCCCGNRILVGPDAGARLAGALDDSSGYRMDVTPLTMPWGQPLEVALAIPATGSGSA